MGKFLNQRMKIIFAICLIIISIYMIRMINNSKLAKVQEQRDADSIIKVKYGSKIYENKLSENKISNKKQRVSTNQEAKNNINKDTVIVNINNDENIDENINQNEEIHNETNENNQKSTSNNIDTQIEMRNKSEENNFWTKLKDNVCNLLNINKKVAVDTKDVDAPNNIEKIDVKVLEDNAIINFDIPKDNGTDYEYIVENSQNSENLKFHSESGVYGYSYKISNDETVVADENVNKLDNAPIVLQNIDWDKNYYLHIRTIDRSNNVSDNKTIKINLPSLGVKVEYVDKATSKLLGISEKITGMINDNYNVNNKIKEIQDYTFVGTTGNAEGLFKRDLTTIQFEYAKNTKLSIKYVDELTGQELESEKVLDGYVGKEVEMNPVRIEEYIPNEKTKKIKMTGDNNEVVFTYKKLENKIEIKDNDSVQEIIDDNESKDIIKTTENDNLLNGIKQVNEANNSPNDIKHEIKNNSDKKEEQIKKRNIKVRYIDINTNKLLLEDTVLIEDEKWIKYKIKEIEGYKLISNMNENNGHQDEQDDRNTIMDEIISSLDIEDDIKNDKNNGLTEEEKRKTIAQYEIVMNCDESDYIIYYKK